MNKKLRLVAGIKDYLMFIRLLKSLICAFTLLTIFISTHSFATTNKEWIMSSPSSYDDVESMFIDRGCSFAWPMAYIYSPATEQILPAAEAKRLFPEFESIFGNDGCAVTLELSVLNAALNLSIKKQNVPIFLFFNPPFDPKSGETFSLNQKMQQFVDDRIALASKVKHPFKYLITTPLTGIRL